MPDYERLHRLGEGNFGEVWLVYDRALGVRRAVKYVRQDRIHDPTDFYHEPHTLMELRHDNIVRVEDAGRQPDGTLYVAMEYLPRGSLEAQHRGKPLQLIKFRTLLCNVCWGLEYAHEQGYIHRDIKPSNILIGRSGEAKLSDFGLATQVPRGGTASPYGYLTHVGPEVFRYGAADRLTDIYALGVTAYRLVNGDGFLPQLATTDELQDMVLAGAYPDRTRYRPHIPVQLRRAINKAMNPERVRRFQRASDFRHALEAVPICCNWGWKQRRREIVYHAKINDIAVRVKVITRSDRHFDLVTTKHFPSGIVRRVTSDCHAEITLTQLKVLLHRILSRYVTYGR